jgi:hypothetical protein
MAQYPQVDQWRYCELQWLGKIDQCYDPVHITGPVKEKLGHQAGDYQKKKSADNTGAIFAGKTGNTEKYTLNNT